jgi:glycosyltransferase involved in cell wall biosynthesis
MAEITRLIFDSLLEKYPGRYDLHQLGLIHFHAVTPANWPIYPTQSITLPDGRGVLSKDDMHGQKTIYDLLKQLEPDILFAYNDPQNLVHLCAEAIKRKHKLVLYVNVDGFPFPPQYECFFNADRIVMATGFSRKVFLSSCHSESTEKLAVIYSPADTTRFAPVLEKDRLELREDLFPNWISPKAFVLGWVGMNQWRKQVWLLYHAIHLLRTGKYVVCRNCQRSSLIDSRHSAEYPMSGMPRGVTGSVTSVTSCPYCASNQLDIAEALDNVFLWLHMAHDSVPTDWPLDVLENLYDVHPGRDIHYTEGLTAKSHLAPSDMATLYQLWDGLLYSSGGEGFGVPAWEAMCTGIPVIYTNYSSHAEFLGNASAGIGVGGVLQPEPSSCILRLVADVSQLLDAVRALYFNRELGFNLGRKGRQYVVRYDRHTQAEKWHRLFQDCLANRQETCVDIRDDMS